MAAEIQDGAFIVARAIFNSSLWTMRDQDRILAITLIGLAKWKETRFFDGVNSITLKPGQLVTSRKVLAEAANLSEQTIRTSLRRLEKSGFLTRKSTNNYTLITIPKYQFYQDFSNYSDRDQPRIQPATNQHSTSTQPAPNQRLTKLEAEMVVNQEVNPCEEGEECKEGEEGGRRGSETSPPVETLWKLFKKCGITGSDGQLRDLAAKLASTYRPGAVEHTIERNPDLRGIDVFVLERRIGNGLFFSGDRNCPDCKGSGKEKGSRCHAFTGRHPYCHCVRVPLSG